MNHEVLQLKNNNIYTSEEGNNEGSNEEEGNHGLIILDAVFTKVEVMLALTLLLLSGGATIY